MIVVYEDLFVKQRNVKWQIGLKMHRKMCTMHRKMCNAFEDVLISFQNQLLCYLSFR